MKTFTLIAAVAFLFVLTAFAAEEGEQRRAAEAAPATGKPISLGLNLTQGRSFRYEHRIEQEIQQEVQGQQQAMQQDMVMGMIVEVVERGAAGDATVRMTYDYLRMTKGTPGSTFTYDSRNPDAAIPEGARAIAAMAGQSIQMTLQPDGHITEVRGVAELIDHILDEAAANLTPEQRAQARQQLGQLFGEQAMIERMHQFLQVYPDRPVDNGDAWSKRFTTSTGMPLVTETTWTLLRHDGQRARLGIDAAIQSNADAPPIRVQTAEIRYDIKGGQRGQMEIDRATGWVVAARIEQALDGEMVITAPNNPTFTIPQRVRSRLSIIEVNDRGNPVREPNWD